MDARIGWCYLARKKRVGFADLEGTRADLGSGALKCPSCNRVVSDADGLRFVAALGQREPSLATLDCPRCRTMLSIRFIAAT